MTGQAGIRGFLPGVDAVNLTAKAREHPSLSDVMEMYLVAHKEAAELEVESGQLL